MSPSDWNLLAHPATGWRAWWIERRWAHPAGGRQVPMRVALALGAAVCAVALGWQGLGGPRLWGAESVAAPAVPASAPAPVAPAWWRAWQEAQRQQPRLLALEAALPPWDHHAPERSRLWQGDAQHLQWQGRTAEHSALVARLQQAWGAPWRWHSLTREADDSGALTLHSTRPSAPPAPQTSATADLQPAATALPRSDQTEQLWPWVQAGVQAHGLQVQQLRPHTATAPQASASATSARAEPSPAEAQLHLVLQGQWSQWLALRQALWQQAPAWQDVRWRVAPAPNAPDRLQIDWQLRWPVRPAVPAQPPWQPPAWAAAPAPPHGQALATPEAPPEAAAWRDLGRWHEGPQVRAMLQGPHGAGLWAQGQRLPHTPWRVQRITPHTVWLQGPHGPPWPLPRRETP